MRLSALLLPAFLLCLCAAPAVRAQDTKPPPEVKPPQEKIQEQDHSALWKEAGASLDRGVAWLRKNQKDGAWLMQQHDEQLATPGYTALALTAVARALPKDKRASDPLVQASEKYLLGKQAKNGAIETPELKGYENYLTSATLLALTIVDDPATKDAREKMKAYIESVQHREKGRMHGGFGYYEGAGADLSNAQFAIEALRSAGVPEDSDAMKQALIYLERCQNRSENDANQGATWRMENKGEKVKVVPGNDGSAAYQPGFSKAGLQKLPDGTFTPRGYGSMTYALLKSYILVGLKKDDPRIKAALEWLGKHYTWSENPGFEAVVKEDPSRSGAPYWGLFYYYMTAARALNLSGVNTLQTPSGPRYWRADLAKALVSRQKPDGSWMNDKSPRWDEGNPALSTAYAVIALEEILRK